MHPTEYVFRVNMGLQCPECGGVQISSRIISKHHSIAGAWQCEECGCQWDRNRFPTEEPNG